MLGLSDEVCLDSRSLLSAALAHLVEVRRMGRGSGIDLAVRRASTVIATMPWNAFPSEWDRE